MKKKMTDLFDDIPMEMLDEIRAGQREQKNYKKTAAAILVVFICLIAGTAGYAAAYPEQFRQFLDGSGSWFGLMLNQSYETRNEDYCLRVEDMLEDGDEKIILISVEGLNEDSKRELNSSETFPTVQFHSDGGGSVWLYSREDGKKYFFASYDTGGKNCEISYAEGLEMLCDEDWLAEHEEELLTLSVKIRNKDHKVITIQPNRNEFPDGIDFRRIEIRRMGVKIKGYSIKKSEEITPGEITNYYCPTVTAVLKDGRKIRLIEGNMGYEADEVDEKWPTGGGGSDISENSKKKKIKVEFYDNFQKIFDIDAIESVVINDMEYKVR